MIIIPIFQTTSSDFIQKISLGGQLVKIRLKYNIRSFSFHIDFTDSFSNIITGIKLVPNWLLLRGHSRFLSFSGDLIVLKADEKASPTITYDNFGSGWELLYMTEDEASVWRSDNGL